MKNVLSIGLSLILIGLSTIASGQKRLVLSTYNSQITDVTVASLTPDFNWGGEPHLNCYAWTQGGLPNIVRPLIRFDLAAIPAGAKIDEALLVLHYDPFTSTIGGHTGGTAFVVQRITQPWDEFTATWNNQPATTTVNQLQVPAAAYAQQNYVLDVTAIVKDIQADPAKNYGLMMRLNNETPFNTTLIAGANHPDRSRHPQLWITYDDGLTDAPNNKLATPSGPRFSVFPNPSSGEVTLNMTGFYTGDEYQVAVFDVQGKEVHTQTVSSSFAYLYLNHLNNGVYILKISNASGYAQEAKVVLAH